MHLWGAIHPGGESYPRVEKQRKRFAVRMPAEKQTGLIFLSRIRNRQEPDV